MPTPIWTRTQTLQQKQYAPLPAAKDGSVWTNAARSESNLRPLLCIHRAEVVDLTLNERHLSRCSPYLFGWPFVTLKI